LAKSDVGSGQDLVGNPPATETLRPNAAGDETSIESQFPASGAHWEKVDEVEADDDTSYVQDTTGSYKRDLYNLPASSGSGVINFIKIYFKCMGQPEFQGFQPHAKPSLKSNSKVTDGTEVNLTGWTMYSEQWDKNPADDEAWEWADIDALQIGVSLHGTVDFYARCTQVYVEIDFTPAGEGLLASLDSSEAGSGQDVVAQAQAILQGTESGGGADSLISLLAVLAKSDSGVGLDAVLENCRIAADAGVGVDGITSLDIKRALRLVVLTSQLRQIQTQTSQHRKLKAITSQLRNIKGFTSEG